VACNRLGDDGLMPADLDAMVDAYWRYHQLLHGTRQERLARDAYFWAWDAVETAVMESPSEAIEMIDAMLRHPDADPMFMAWWLRRSRARFLRGRSYAVAGKLVVSRRVGRGTNATSAPGPRWPAFGCDQLRASG
jgi:hypothetical protein